MKRKIRSFGTVFLVLIMMVNLLSFSTPAYAETVPDDAYDTLRLRIYDMLTGGPSYDPADPDIAPKIEALTSKAQSHWNSMEKSAGRTYLWSDLDTTKDSPSPQSEHVSGAYQHLETMTLAYCTRGSSLYNNAALLADIISGMDWLYTNRYNTSIIKRGYDNWFDWQVTSPLCINNISILLYSSLTPKQISDWQAVIDWQKLEWGAGLVGANRVWACNIVVTRGIITKNSGKILEGRDQLSPVFDYVTSGEGIYKEGSFLMHTALVAYNGGYGVALMDNLTKVMYILAGSPWDITDPDVKNIYQWVYTAFEPLFYNNSMLDMVRGREIAGYSSDMNGKTSMKTLGTAIVRMAMSAPSASDAAKYKAMVKKWMNQATSPTPYTDLGSIGIIQQTKQIMQDSSVVPRGELIMNKQYPNMAKAVHLRPGYAFGVSMFSNRTANYEMVNETNLKGWHTGDGMTYIYNADIAQYQDNFWPTVNSHRLPGTTVVRNSTGTPNTRSGNNWVGGTDMDGLYGVTGMQFKAVGYALTAKKSWFMFDDEIVCLGSDITSTDPAVVETIVENRKLNGTGDNALTVDNTAKSNSIGWNETMTGVHWAHLAGNVAGSDIGYYFPAPVTLNGLRESRTDSWNSINQYYKDPSSNPGNFQEYTRNYLNLWMEHGTNPTNDTYSYVLLPGKSSSEVNTYSGNPNITIVENSPEAQAVKENTLGIMGINFWNDTVKTVEKVTSNKKASVMVKTSATDVEVSVSDPTQANKGTIDLELDMTLGNIISIDPGVAVSRSGSKWKLSVNVKDAGGKAFRVKFDLTGGVSAGPSVPTGLYVTGSTENTVSLAWNAAAGATDYRLYRSDALTGEYQSIPDVTPGATTYTDTNAVSGNYFYKVAAVNERGVSDYSSPVSAWTLPAAPTNLSMTANAGSSITMKWNAVAGASAYKLYRSTDRELGYIQVNGAGYGETSYTDTGLDSATNYYYKVVAANSGGDSKDSNIITTLFSVPVYGVNEDFNGFDLGDLNGQHDWVSDISADGHTIVLEEAAAADKRVKIRTNSKDGGASGVKNFTVPNGSIVIAEATVIADNADWKNALMLLDSTLTANNVGVHLVIQGGKIWGYNGGTKTDIQLGITAGTPYKLKAVVNTATKKFDVYVDDVLKATNWSYRYSPTTVINRISFGIGGNASSMSYDSVKIAYMPATPVNLTASDNKATSIKLSWNAAPGAAEYRLYRSTASTGGYQLITGNGYNALTYTDTGLNSDTTYYYKLSAVNGNAISGESTTLSAATIPLAPENLTPPTGLTASENTATSIKLSWNGVGAANQYRLYRATSSTGSFEQITGAGFNALEYTDKELSGGTTYYYKVVAVNGASASADSSVITTMTVPNAPAGLTVTDNMGSSIRLTWNAAIGATDYRLFRSTRPDEGFETVTGIVYGALYHTDTGLSSGNTYYYKVAGVNSSGISADSGIVSTMFRIPVYLVNNNFDTFATGDLNGQEGWVVDNGGTAGNTVTVQSISDTDKRLRIVTTATTGKAEAGHVFTVPSGSVITAEVTATADDANWKNVLYLADTAVNAVSIVMQSGKIWGYNGGTKTDLYASVVYGTPYRIKVVVNTSTKKFDVYVNDVKLGDQWAYRSSSATNLNKLTISIGGNASTMSVDNVKVSYMPAVPTALTASEKTVSSTKLTWSAANGATGYRLYRSTAPSGEYRLITADNFNGLTYTDTGLKSKTTYYYKVAATNGNAVSAESSTVLVETDSLVLAAPTALTVSENSVSGMKLSWSAVPQALEYRIYRATSQNGEYELITGNGYSALSYTDTGLSSGTTYYYKVAAVNGGSVSADSSSIAAVTVPDAPTGLTAGENTASSIKLTWNTVVGATDYILYRSSARYGSYQTVTGTVYGAEYHTDTGLVSGTTYFFKVAAVNSAGISADSEVISVATAPEVVAVPATPTGLTAVENTSSSIKLVWDAVTGATDYRLYRSTMPNGGYQTVTGAVYGATSHTDTGLMSGTIYYYKVAAVNAAGISPESDIIPVMTTVEQAPIPAVPTGLTASENTTSSIKLTWNAATDATDYRLYRSTELNGLYQTVAGVVYGALSHTDTSLGSGTTYYYKVAAVNAAGISERSTAIAAATNREPDNGSDTGNGGGTGTIIDPAREIRNIGSKETITANEAEKVGQHLKDVVQGVLGSNESSTANNIALSSNTVITVFDMISKTEKKSRESLLANALDAVTGIKNAAKALTEEAKIVSSAKAVTDLAGKAADVAATADGKEQAKDIVKSVKEVVSAVIELADKVSPEEAIIMLQNVINSSTKLVAAENVGIEGKKLAERMQKAAAIAVEKAGKQDVAAQVSGNTAVVTGDSVNTAEILTKAVAAVKAADAVVAALKKNGLNSEVDRKVVISSNAPAAVTDVTAVLPSGMMKVVEDKGIDQIVFKSNVATIGFAPDAIAAAAGERIAVGVRIANGEKELTPEQKTIVGDHVVYDFSAAVLQANGKEEGVRSFKTPVEVKIPYELKPGQRADNLTVFFLNEDGRLENKGGTYDPTTKRMCFTTDHFSRYIVKNNTVTFTDVKATHWAASSVEVLASKGIISGQGDGSFRPEDQVTRAEFTKMLMGALNIGAAQEKADFMDVDENAWYAGYIASAVKAGIIAGKGDRTFAPEELVSREDMAVMIMRAVKLANTAKIEQYVTFADKSAIAEYALSSVATAVKYEMIFGKGDNAFDPKGNATRAEAAAMIHRLMAQ